MEKMKAIVFRGPNDFSLEEVEKPKCNDEEILVKVEACGLCGSDIRTFASGHNKVTPPFIIGHEGVGMVEESKSKYFKPGDKVMINPGITCKKCFYCKKDIESQCENMIVVGTTIPGIYAQYISLPKEAANPTFVHKLPDDIDLDIMPVAEALASVYSTQDNVGVGDGDTVLIIGAGPLGNLHSAMAKARGAKKVIISEMHQNRLDMAKKFDTTDVFVNPGSEDLQKVIMEHTDGKGVDIAITACPVGEVQSEVTHLVRSRGKVLLFGGLPKDNCMVTFDSNLLHYKEIEVIGGFSYSSDCFKAALDYIVSKKVDAKKFVTHKLPLKDVKKGIELVKTGEAIKVILKPWM